MAKKASKRKESAKPVEGEKVAFQVRVDRDLHERMSKIAEQAGMSLNQLVQGMCRGAMKYVNVGTCVKRLTEQPTCTDDWYYESQAERGCVWFGKAGHERFEGMIHDVEQGKQWFWIDTRERGQVHHEE